MIDLIVSFMLGQFLWHLVGIVQFLQSSFVCTEINTFGIICGLMCFLSFNVFSKLSPNDSSFIHMPILKCFFFFMLLLKVSLQHSLKLKLFRICTWHSGGTSVDLQTRKTACWALGEFMQEATNSSVWFLKPLFCFTWYVHSGGKGKSVILHRFCSRALACL